MQKTDKCADNNADKCSPYFISVENAIFLGQSYSLSSDKPFTSISTSLSNSLLITGSFDSTVRLWDPRSHEGSLVKQSFTGHHDKVSSVCWNKTNENLFISASYDKIVKMWDISGGVDCSVKLYKRNP
ncbi:unnamed protein product [Gongylonema pulchrum]|uniref:Uncharacterized protein n=1 Tax=Gongylonema pulchrum TaxID=637853 RepID=A0A3P6NZR4_9BILA|nr:unnamed protein product [Gongylonema pulchrum]